MAKINKLLSLIEINGSAFKCAYIAKWSLKKTFLDYLNFWNKKINTFSEIISLENESWISITRNFLVLKGQEKDQLNNCYMFDPDYIKTKHISDYIKTKHIIIFDESKNSLQIKSINNTRIISEGYIINVTWSDGSISKYFTDKLFDEWISCEAKTLVGLETLKKLNISFIENSITKNKIHLNVAKNTTEISKIIDIYDLFVQYYSKFSTAKSRIVAQLVNVLYNDGTIVSYINYEDVFFILKNSQKLSESESLKINFYQRIFEIKEKVEGFSSAKEDIIEDIIL